MTDTFGAKETWPIPKTPAERETMREQFRLEAILLLQKMHARRNGRKRRAKVEF